MSDDTQADPATSTALRPRDTRRRKVAAPAKKKGLLHYLGLGLSGLLLLVVILLAAVLIVIPKVAGATPLTVLTNSMAPGMPPGTLIYVLPVEAKDVQIGDVVTYQIRSGSPDLITHRVIGINPGADGPTAFIFKGDNNGEADDPVKPVQIKAKFWYEVPYLGFVNSEVNGKNRSWIIPIVAIGLIAYAAYLIISGLVSSVVKRRRKRGQVPQRHSAR